jgi:hypothetical protein
VAFFLGSNATSQAIGFGGGGGLLERGYFFADICQQNDTKLLELL